MPDNPVYTLGSIKLDVLEMQGLLDGAKRDFATASNPLGLAPVQTLDFVSDQRQLALAVKIVGVESTEESAADNKARQIFNLSVELAKASNTLTVTGAGRTTPTLFRVMKCDPLPAPVDYLYEYGDEALIPVVLNVEPWTEGTQVTATLATSAPTPDVVDLAIVGEVPTPLALTATRGFAGSGLQTLILAAVPGDVDLEDMLHLAMDASAPNWSPYTATSGYVDASDNTLMCTSESWRAMYWGSALPAGRYAIFAKTRVQTGGKGWLAQARTSNDQSAPSAAVTDNDWRFVRLGDWASDGYTPPRIIGKCRESAKGILVDWLLYVPLDLGSAFYFHCTTTAVASVVSEWLETTMQTTGGATRSARRFVSGPGVCGVGAMRLLVAACDAAGDLRQPSLTLAATYTPLYTNWVPTTEA